jgi:hypothetical protein
MQRSLRGFLGTFGGGGIRLVHDPEDDDIDPVAFVKSLDEE